MNFVIKTRQKSVSRDNSKITRKEISKLIRVTTSPFVEMWLDEMLRKKGIKKKMMDFDYCEEYLTNISNKILLWQS